MNEGEAQVVDTSPLRFLSAANRDALKVFQELGSTIMAAGLLSSKEKLLIGNSYERSFEEWNNDGRDTGSGICCRVGLRRFGICLCFHSSTGGCEMRFACERCGACVDEEDS